MGLRSPGRMPQNNPRHIGSADKLQPLYGSDKPQSPLYPVMAQGVHQDPAHYGPGIVSLEVWRENEPKRRGQHDVIRISVTDELWS